MDPNAGQPRQRVPYQEGDSVTAQQRVRMQHEAQRKPLHTDLFSALRNLQTSILKTDGNELDVREAYKSINKLLDNATEKTRKRPPEPNDQIWSDKRMQLKTAKDSMMDIVRKKTT